VNDHNNEKEEVVLRPEVQWFAEQMESTLRKNDHKDGWEDCSFQYLYSNLREEIQELWVESYQCPINWEGVLRESPDIGNYSMMIAELARRRLNESL
jgi:hypothetical protein